MKRLISIILAAALLWGAFWGWQAYTLKSDIAGWFETRRAVGWEAAYDRLKVRGFPNRLDVTLEGLRLQDPDSGLGWNAPFLQVLGLTYQPGHQIIAFPEAQTFLRPSGPLRVESQGLLASLIYDADGRILRMNAEAETLNLVSSDGSLALAGVLAAVQGVAEASATYRLGVEVQAAAREGALSDGRVDALTVQAEIDLAEPLTLDTLSDPRPQPRRVDLRQAEYRVERLELHLAGEVDIDGQGRMDGDVTLRAVNWKELVTRARESGMLPEMFSDTLEDALSLAAGLQGRADTLDIPLNLDRGALRFGLIPLGQAPRLSWE